MFCTSSIAQSVSAQKKSAKNLFENSKFREAAVIYESLFTSNQLNEDDLERSVKSFQLSNKLNLAQEACLVLIKKYNKEKEYYLLLAKLYQQNNHFIEAAVAYKDYLKKIKKSDPERRHIEQEIIRCSFANKLKRKDKSAIVEPLGTNINTDLDEFAAFPSVNHPGKYYFSKTKKTESLKKIAHYDSDLFSIEDNNGIWSEVQSLGSDFNSEKNEVILDFTEGAKSIFFLRSKTEFDGEFLVVKYGDNEINNLNAFDLPLDHRYGDQSLSMFQDSVLIFSSKRPGGYGGYDLYLSIYREGNWLIPKNLGPVVNSPFDELDPFIAKDGQSLYFSSNNLSTIGGFDIFRTRFKPESREWNELENLGMPINSAGNDRQFRLNRDGLSGVYSSDRLDLSKGGKDIFIAYFKDELEEQSYDESGTVFSLLFFNQPGSEKSKSENPYIRDSLVQIQQFNIDILNCKEDDFLNDKKNQNILEEVYKILKQNPESKLQIIGHLNISSNSMLNLFNSVKKSIEANAYFANKQIDPLRIENFGVGNEFLMCKTNLNGVHYPPSEPLNNRIELNILNSTHDFVNINYNAIKLSDVLIINPAYKFQDLRKNLSYSILLGESTQMLNKEIPDLEDQNAYVEWRNGKYYYYLGIFDSFNQSTEFVKKHNLSKNSIIHSFFNGDYIDQNSIINYVSKYPELILLIEYNKFTRH